MSFDLSDRAELLHGDEHDDLEYAESELHYTRFESYEDFQELTERHGLKLTANYPDATHAWAWVAPDGLTLQTSRAPFEGREGYCSYTFVRGPAGAAEALFRDIVESATYIKGEFSPLTLDGGGVLVSLDEARPDPEPEETDDGPGIESLFAWLRPPSRQPAYEHVAVSIPGSDAATLRESNYAEIAELPAGATYGSGVNR